MNRSVAIVWTDNTIAVCSMRSTRLLIFFFFEEKTKNKIQLIGDIVCFLVAFALVLFFFLSSFPSLNAEEKFFLQIRRLLMTTSNYNKNHLHYRFNLHSLFDRPNGPIATVPQKTSEKTNNSSCSVWRGALFQSEFWQAFTRVFGSFLWANF